MTKPTLLPGCAAFVVEELPAYEPCGQGEHLYVFIEKEDLNTEQVAEALAKACHVPRMAVGYAGRKDRRAITRQWFSIHQGNIEQLTDFQVGNGRVQILSHSRHRNKLRVGHLTGNRFRLEIGGISQPETLQTALDNLARDGLPNRFGAQRFGLHGGNLLLALAWGQGDLARAVAMCVDPRGQWQMGQPLPHGYRSGPEGRVLGALRKGAAAGAALRAGGEEFRSWIASAAQSAIFNAVLDARNAAGLLRTARPGDICLNHKGAPFRVGPDEGPATSERCQRLDAILTGPLPGNAGLQPDPELLVQEKSWSASTGMDWAWFADRGVFSSPGQRRALLIPFLEAPKLIPGNVDRPILSTDLSMVLSMTLPSGAYATEVLAHLGITGRGQDESSAS